MNFDAVTLVEVIERRHGRTALERQIYCMSILRSSSQVTNMVRSIHDYAANGDAEAVRAELSKGIRVDTRNEQDFTPLACAVMNPSVTVEMISLLIENGANVNAAVEERKSFPLGLAACAGNLESTRLLLDARASVNAATASGYTALISSVYRLNDSESLVPMIELLVDHGANVDCETDYGERAITVASRLRTALNCLIPTILSFPAGWSRSTKRAKGNTASLSANTC